MEIADRRDAVGDGRRAAGERERFALRRPLGAVELIFLPHDADEHADLALRQRGARVAGVLDGFVGALQEQPLLRVHVGRLARGDVEEQRVELGDAVDEAAPFCALAALKSRRSGCGPICPRGLP